MPSLVGKLQPNSLGWSVSLGCTVSDAGGREMEVNFFRERGNSGPSCLGESNDVSHWSGAGFTPAQSAAGWGVGAADDGDALLTSSVISECVQAMKSSGSGSVVTASLFPQQPNGPTCRIASL